MSCGVCRGLLLPFYVSLSFGYFLFFVLLCPHLCWGISSRFIGVFSLLEGEENPLMLLHAAVCKQRTGERTFNELLLPYIAEVAERIAQGASNRV